jgi:DNA processing protein
LGNSLTADSPEWQCEIRSVLRLGCVPGVGTRALWRILGRFGSARRALDASPAKLDAVAGCECSVALASSVIERRVRDAMDRSRALSIKILLWTDRAYPERLTQLADPPPILFTRGRIELLEGPAVTIVGSRRSTAYGRRSAEALAAQMALRGITVVSGLALGIDGASHRGALRASGDTIAVLGSGVDLIQPASHRRLGEHIGREGLLLSEFLPGESARAYHFPRRNRILAALGGAVVVVEAAEKSGALITVEHALDLGRDVYAVPGALDAPQSRGCNLLICQGAQVITSPEEFGRDLGLVCGSSPEFRLRPAPERTRDLGGASAIAGAGDKTTRPGDEWSRGPGDEAGTRSDDDVPAGLDGEARRVWHVLKERSLGIDDVASDSDLRSARVLAALTTLQVAGLVVQESGMRFRRAS